MTKIVIKNNKYNKKKILPCSVGYYPKSWIWHNKKYCLAKLNDNQKTNENFGELLYSIMSKDCKMNCVNTSLCTLENIHKNPEENYGATTNQAVLVENFLKNEQKLLHFSVIRDFYLETMVFPDVNYTTTFASDRDYLLTYHVDLENLPNWYKTIEYYAEKNAYNLSDFKTELAKYLILDWFLMQEDRSAENLAFIVEGNNLKLAPCYDNGRCLVFYEHCNENLSLDSIINSRLNFSPIVDFGKSDKKLNFNPQRYDISVDTKNMDYIINLAENNKEIKRFVKKLLNVDMKNLLNEMDISAKQAECEPLENNAKMLAEYFYNYKVNNFKKYAKIHHKILEK